MSVPHVRPLQEKITGDPAAGSAITTAIVSAAAAAVGHRPADVGDVLG